MSDYYLFLDDERFPDRVFWINLPKNVNWTIVRNYNQFVEIVASRGLPVFITYDHDLADQHYSMTSEEVNSSSYEKVLESYDEKTGYSCAKWLINYCIDKKIKHPAYSVHSMNPIGSENIKNLIECFNKNYD
jgi:hypothetical protein